jgi:hypothetical protein
VTIFERIPQAIFDNYTSWKSDTSWGRKSWLNRAVNSEEYYYNDVEQTGTTYTAAQVSKIEDNTNIPVSMNWLYPVANQKLALLLQSKPSLRVVSTDGRAKQVAQVLDKIKHGIFYESNSQVELEAMIKDMLIAGMGHIMVAPNTEYKDGIFPISIMHVPFDEVILDINAKKRNLEDMQGFFIEKAFTIPRFMQLYGGIFEQLRMKNGEAPNIGYFTNQTWIEGELTDKQSVTTTNWDADDAMIVREYYEKVYTTAFLVKNPQTGLVEYLFAENLDEQQSTLLNVADSQITDVFIKKTILFGDYAVWAEVLPITEYPLKTVFFEWGGRPYRSYGMVHFTKGMQEAFDKILQIMLLNGILSNNAGWTAPKGSIPEEDRKKWEDFGNNPRVIKEFVPKIYENQVLVPEKDQVTQLGNFYPMVLEMLKGGIEYSTGITPILQGNSQEAGIEVFSSLQQYQSAAMMRIVLSTMHINQVLRQLGQVLVEYIAASIRPDVYQFFDEKGDLNEASLTIDFINNMRSYRYMVATTPATAMPTQRLAMGTELMKIAQSSPDPAERQILTQKAMELSDIREFEDVTQRLDAVKNAQAKIQDLQEAYNRLLETSKQMENKYINIALENKVLQEMARGEQDIAAKFAELNTKLSLADEIAEARIKAKGETSQQKKGK